MSFTKKDKPDTVPCSACGGTGRIHIRQNPINKPPIEPPATEEEVAAHMKKIRADLGKMRMPKIESTHGDHSGLTEKEYMKFKKKYLD